jgi:hypothetical protein
MDKIQTAALILILVGALLPALCIIKMQMIKKFKKNATVTKAIINNTEKRIGYKGAVYYMLAIQYKDNAGNIFKSHAIGAKKNIPGSTITIMYKTNNPASFKTDFGKHLPWVLGFSLILFGFLLWLACTLLNYDYY